MFLTTKTTTYRCTGAIPAIEAGFVKFGRFPSGVDHSCDVSIWIKTIKPAAPFFIENIHGEDISVEGITVDVLVQKSNQAPAKVDSTLMMSPRYEVDKQKKSIDDWTSSFYFRDWLVWPYDNEPLNVVLDITWTIPKSANVSFKVSNFLMNETFSDVDVIIGGEKLFAHKLVLGAASPVMLAMLTSPMKEAAENCIEIKDVQVDVMKAILRLLYTAEDDDFESVDMALKALVAAEKYDMGELKKLCENKLLANLSTANALQILDVADTHQSEKLVKESMAFIIDHKEDTVLAEDFQEICTKKPLLMMEFITTIVNSLDIIELA